MLLSIHHSMLCSSSSLVSAKTIPFILCSVMSRQGTCIPHFPDSSLLDFASKRYSWEITGGQREATPCLLGLADIPLTAANSFSSLALLTPEHPGCSLGGQSIAPTAPSQPAPAVWTPKNQKMASLKGIKR